MPALLTSRSTPPGMLGVVPESLAEGGVGQVAAPGSGPVRVRIPSAEPRADRAAAPSPGRSFRGRERAGAPAPVPVRTTHR